MNLHSECTFIAAIGTVLRNAALRNWLLTSEMDLKMSQLERFARTSTVMQPCKCPWSTPYITSIKHRLSATESVGACPATFNCLNKYVGIESRSQMKMTNVEEMMRTARRSMHHFLLIFEYFRSTLFNATSNCEWNWYCPTFHSVDCWTNICNTEQRSCYSRHIFITSKENKKRHVLLMPLHWRSAKREKWLLHEPRFRWYYFAWLSCLFDFDDLRTFVERFSKNDTEILFGMTSQ